MDRHHVQPVIQVFAEAARGDLAARSRVVDEITRTSTETVSAPPTRWKALLHQHAQDLRLGAERHVGDLVEIEDAAMGLFEQAGLDPAFRRFAAEQHLLHAVRRRPRPS